MKRRRLTFIILIFSFIALALLISVITRPSIPLDSQGKLKVYTRNKPKAEISVAVIDGDNVTYRAYGVGGKEIELPERRYEIGSITTTVTGAMVSSAVGDQAILLNDKVSDHIVLATGTYVPTMFELVTHTSAYGNYLAYSKTDGFKGTNPFKGIDYPKVITSMEDFRLNQTPPYLYSVSDFGATVAGMVLEDTYGEQFGSLMDGYLVSLGLDDTFIATSDENVPENGWLWETTDEYVAAYGLSTTIEDMVKYAKLYIDGQNENLNRACMPLIEVNKEISIGYFWGINTDGQLEKSGETSHYASKIIIDRENRQAVIVLSNYANDKFGEIPDIANAIMEESFSD